jgi:hypothetical protein
MRAPLAARQDRLWSALCGSHPRIHGHAEFALLRERDVLGRRSWRARSHLQALSLVGIKVGTKMIVWDYVIVFIQ